MSVDVREQAEQTQQRVQAQVQELRGRVDQVAKPAVKRSRVTALSMVPRLVAVVTGLIAWLPRMLGGLSSATTLASERGSQLSMQARDLAHRVPPSPAARRRQRARSFGLLAAATALGMLIGYALGRRGATHVTYEPAVVDVTDMPTNGASGDDPGSEAASGSGDGDADTSSQEGDER